MIPSFRRLLLLAAGAAIPLLGLAETLVPSNGAWRYFKGRAEASSPDATAWRTVGFPDATWTLGNAPFWGRDWGQT